MKSSPDVISSPVGSRDKNAETKRYTKLKVIN